MSTVTRIQLDVRLVAPGDQFDMIMAAYERLEPGAAMELVVDHDPLCMYYTLRATRRPGSFSFEYLEDGPEAWRVEISPR